MSLKVNLDGHNYWLVGEHDSLAIGGPITEPKHCDDEGHIKPEFSTEDSFAYWAPGVGVIRYGDVINKTLAEGWVSIQ